MEDTTPGDVTVIDLDAVTAVAVTSEAVTVVKVTSFVIVDGAVMSVGVADDIDARVVMSAGVVAIVTSEVDGEDDVTVAVATSE